MPQKPDFVRVLNSIFKNQPPYETLTEEEKEAAFFMVQRKLAKGMPREAEFLNGKGIDRASAIDLWRLTVGSRWVPEWYWRGGTKKSTPTEKGPVGPADLLMELYGLTREDYEFLLIHYREEVDEELKKLSRFDI